MNSSSALLWIDASSAPKLWQIERAVDHSWSLPQNQ